MKLSIAIDMGAKNNGIFIAKTENKKIIDKKAFNIVIDKNSINFSKKSRRENRHRVRNYSRRKLAKRLLWQFLDKNNFTYSQIEQINGLLNNRGYTFLSTSSEFEEINLETVEFLNTYLSELKELQTKDDFEAKLSEFELEGLEIFINEITDKINIEYKKKKNEFYKHFRENHSIIKKDLKLIRDFFNDILKELKTGSKPRKKYLEEIKSEINTYDFIDNKEKFFNLIGNISNLQLRILRKLIQKKDYKLLKNYFSMFHWNYNDKEKIQKKKLFEELKKYNNLETFFKQTNPELTIPPYEDMNNRDTYKCNSLLINPKYISEPLKKAISILEKQVEFEVLNLSNLSDSQKLQRILDINSKLISPSLSPREVFKKDKGDINYYKKLLKDSFSEFSDFAKKYYDLESKAINGIFEDGLLIKCNKNTPSKNNFKHILLKPLYEYDFSIDDVEKFVEKIKQTKGLQTHLKNISDTAKTYQNSFYHHIEACYENKKCIDDKNIKNIIKNLDNDFKAIKEILNSLGFKTYLNDIELKDNLKRVLNTFKQTYEILFKDINGFSKTCKSCTIENNYRSNEKIAKRLLSDVAKPIDGMLDMMLDRIAWEVVSNIDEVDKKVEIILEQNRFLFEDNLASIKGKKTKKRDFKDLLNLNICPYTGENITDTNGEYDHILPQSKELFNSKANLIYCSSKGNREKSNKRVYLNQLNPKHLKEIFETDDINKIKNDIKANLSKIDKEKFTNFNNLPLEQQIALRYALFFEENTDEFKKAKEILKQDKLKTITNGTQKRLARLIFEKLTQKFKKEIDCNVKVINNFLVSATRKDLSYDHETGEINELWKEKYQDTHSHCIDAMVVFYLANSTIKGTHHQKQHNLATLQPIYKFSNIYLKDSDEIKVKKTTIKDKILQNKKMDSIANVETLFRENMLSNHYLNIYFIDNKFYYGETKKQILPFPGFNIKILDFFKQQNILIEFENKSFRINKQKLYETLFNNKQMVITNYSFFKKIDELRYTTQKKSIISLVEKLLNPTSNDEKKFIKSLINKNKLTNIEEFNKNNLIKFFEKGSKLEHKKIKLKLTKSWQVIAKFLEEYKKDFLIQTENKLIYNHQNLYECLKNCKIFKKTHYSKRKITNGFSLPLKDTTDKPFLIRRKDDKNNFIYQVVFAKNSARGFVGDIYIHQGHKNIIPLKIEDYQKAFKSETHNNK